MFSIAGALGRVARVNKDILPANTNQALAIIRLRPELKILAEYIMMVLRSPLVVDQIDLMKKESAQANLSLKNVSDFEIPLPPLSVQREVVARLDSAKARAEKLEAKAREGVTVCETMRKAILKEAFE